MPPVRPPRVWRIVPPDGTLREALSRSLDIPPILAQVLVNRGLSEPGPAFDFLHRHDESSLLDPFLLKGMEQAVARIRRACSRGETILVFGDYDVDGVTSSVVVHKTLRRLGGRVRHHIPHRFRDGYGLNEEAVDLARRSGASLVIGVDCGITAHGPLARLKAAGIDGIVLDHHEPTPRGVPDALAVIDPKQEGCPYPFPHLAAVGLAAKLAQALEGRLPYSEMDLVALGTIADVVPIVGENRAFVKLGLPVLERTANKGLAALMRAARIHGRPFRPSYAGFVLGPRINATGRMDSALHALNLLLAEEEAEAARLAGVLEGLNDRRRKVQQEVGRDVVSRVEREVNFNDQRVIVVSGEGWHRGVLGIVAGRVAERYFRPTVVISVEDGIGTASARSIRDFPLHEALEHCSGLLEAYGGHRSAAGLTIRAENIPRFRDLINAFAGTALQPHHLVPSLDIDAEAALPEVDLDLARRIASLEPFGEGNPEPLFCCRGLAVQGRPAVLARDTLKFDVTDGRVTRSVIGFGMGGRAPELTAARRVDLAFHLDVDDWNKSPRPQLRLKDMRYE